MSLILKNTIQYVLHRLGYEMYRYSKVSGKLDYEPVRPVATYSPWNGDKLFLDTYQAIVSHTLVDIYRCYELWTLVEQSYKIPGAIIEVGVWKGGTGALIAKKATLCGITDPVYLCDTFRGVVKASFNDSLYKGGEHADTSKQMVESLVYKQLKLDNIKILEGIFPDQTAHLINSEKFRLCHIDVDVYQSAKDITDWIWDRLAIGGMVIYDDYGFAGCPGVTKYVEEQRHQNDKLLIHNLNGHAMLIKTK